MALSPEKQAQLDALQAEAEASNEDDDFDGEEIEVWNEKGAGARLRGKHSRTWLEENGFLKPRNTEPPADSGDGDGAGDSGKGKTGGRQSKGTPPRTSQKYFGNRTK